MRNSIHTTAIILGLAMLFGSGCEGGRVVINDDIVSPFLFIAQPQPDGLHLPYVRGTETRIHVSSRSLFDVPGNWTATSSDPSVLRIEESDDDRRSLTLDVTAVGEGTSQLTVFDRNGTELRTVSVEVLTADRAVVKPHGDMAGDFEQLVEDTRSFQVVTEGTATFLVQWYAGTVPLYGTGALEVDEDDEDAGIDLTARRTSLFEEREYLEVTPEFDGEFPVTLLADGIAVDEITIEAVPEETIDDVQVYSEGERGATPGQTLHLLAHAVDVDDRPIYGVAFDWRFDGSHEPGEGDLYTYEYDPDEPHTVEVQYDGLSDEVPIHGRNGEVGSTNSIGCNAGGGSAGLTALAGLVAVLGCARRWRR